MKEIFVHKRYIHVCVVEDFVVLGQLLYCACKVNILACVGGSSKTPVELIICV